MTDARFEDAAGSPLRLRAETAEDLAVLAAVLQDAVGTLGDAAWLAKRQRFAAVLNRFRWETGPRRRGERVRAALGVEHVRGVRALGLDPKDKATVVNLLDLAFEPAGDGSGTLRLVLSGGAEIALSVDALEVTVTDLSQPWPARAVPGHGD